MKEKKTSAKIDLIEEKKANVEKNIPLDIIAEVIAEGNSDYESSSSSGDEIR